MGILYQAADPIYWVIWLFILFALMAFNELGRVKLWCGLVLFALVPIALTLFVWPETAAPGNEYGTGTWFNWVKTYSALAGCLGFIALRFAKWRGKDGKTHYLYEKRWALCFPPLILAINIAEAVIRDFQVFGFALWEGGVVENLWTISGPWNIMNGVAGILNILTICGWFGIFISKDPSKDMIWPDMIWAWIIAYDLWNFAYTYNCISDHSAYCGLALLLACTIPTFFIKRGAWLQHRAQTLALWIMFVMTVPQFADVLAPHPDHAQPHGVLRGEPDRAGVERGARDLPALPHPQAEAQPAEGPDLRRHEGLPAHRGGERVAGGADIKTAKAVAFPEGTTHVISHGTRSCPLQFCLPRAP